MNMILSDKTSAGRSASLLYRFIKYFLVGGVAALTEWLIFAGIVYGLRLNYIIAATISFLFATAVNYELGLIFVFGRRLPRYHDILLVYLVSSAGLLINLAELTLFVEWLHFHIIFAKVLATGTAFMWNFMLRHFWLYRRQGRMNRI